MSDHGRETGLACQTPTITWASPWGSWLLTQSGQETEEGLCRSQEVPQNTICIIEHLYYTIRANQTLAP